MMHAILFTIVLAAAIEFITIVLRLVYHLISAKVQNTIHVPRIHHAYFGALLLLLHWLAFDSNTLAFLSSPWIIIIAAALITSDLLHHLLFLPLIKKYNYDLSMARHRQMHLALSRGLGITLIIIGLFALLTPFTPGSWLSIVGAALLFGKKRTRELLQNALGEKLYAKLYIDYFLRNHDKSEH